MPYMGESENTMYTPKSATINGINYEVDKFSEYKSGRTYYHVSTKVNYRWVAVTGRTAEMVVAETEKDNSMVYYKETKDGYVEKLNV